MSPARYEIQLSASAARAFRKLDGATQLRLARQIDSLALNPRPHGTRKLEGERDLYRLRAGDYRIIYTVKDRLLVILVIAIGHRRDIYRR
ncbi:MAG: type II toxin-antitoxin system RelE/ParE family toxin [Gemmatimonadaceae bacterium]|nr:type II toxin-antitoxin system RelE/ParE family toxin [Gemmatimonadaceae bacterium]